MERRQFLQMSATAICGALMPTVSIPEKGVLNKKETEPQAEEKRSIVEALHTASGLLAPYLSLIPNETRLREFEESMTPEARDARSASLHQQIHGSLGVATDDEVQAIIEKWRRSVTGEMTDDEIEQALKKIMYIEPRLKLLAWSPAIIGVFNMNVQAMLLNIFSVVFTRFQLRQKCRDVMRRID